MEGHALWRGSRTRFCSRADEQDPVHPTSDNCGAGTHVLRRPDGCLGTNTQDDHLNLLGEFFAVCKENHTRLKLEKCRFMQETMQYLGFHIGHGW